MIRLFLLGDSSIHVILVDMEFEKLVDMLVKVEVIVLVEQEHVVEVDRTIITAK